MKITEVRVYANVLPKVGDYSMSSARVGDPDSTIVEVVTDTEHVGWGEVCMTGPMAQTHHAASVRADLTLAAPVLVGLDPRQIGVVWRAMNGARFTATPNSPITRVPRAPAPPARNDSEHYPRRFSR